MPARGHASTDEFNLKILTGKRGIVKLGPHRVICRVVQEGAQVYPRLPAQSAVLGGKPAFWRPGTPGMIVARCENMTRNTVQQKRQSWRRLLLCLAAAVIVAPSCGGVNHEEYCREVCADWEPGGIPYDGYDDCVAHINDDADDADVSSCGEEWDDLLACADDESYCLLEGWQVPDACSAAYDGYEECMSPSGGCCGNGSSGGWNSRY